MATKTVRNVPASYLALIKQFPLTHIRDDAHRDEATAVIHRLLERDLDSGAQEYLDVLTDLVGDYEDKHHPMLDASEADVLRELMTANQFSQSKLEQAVGICQSTVSAVLNGTRTLTKEQVGNLATFFRVSPAVFYPQDAVANRKSS